MAIFVMVLGVTKLVKNFCVLWKLPSKIDTVKALKKFSQLLRITFVTLVKFLAMETINVNNGLLKGK